MATQWDHYIDGESQAPSSANYISSFDSCVGQVAGAVAEGGVADVDRAVQAAAAAGPAWRSRRPIERGRILSDIARKIRANAEQLSALERLETGKPAWHAPIEIEIAAQYFEF